MPVYGYARHSTYACPPSISNIRQKIKKSAIAAYALDHDIEIVNTYEDDGRSGITLRNRPALVKLLKDVLDQARAFDAVLVYDISRWGRFQDVDESAHHEYLCRQAGVKVIYCAEPFANDGSPASNIIKSIKRAMAGEFSRELSEKVFLGQSRHVERGFWQGSTPGYGLRRMLVDACRQPKGCLRSAEQKAFRPTTLSWSRGLQMKWRWFGESSTGTCTTNSG